MRPITQRLEVQETDGDIDSNIAIFTGSYRSKHLSPTAIHPWDFYLTVIAIFKHQAVFDMVQIDWILALNQL